MNGLVQLAGWERLGWLAQGFSTREAGNLGWTVEYPAGDVAENRWRLSMHWGEMPMVLVTIRQTHSDVTRVIRSVEGPFATTEGRAVLEGDGLMTDVPGLLLAIQTADCIPVLVVDPVKRVVAVFHAGWRGTAKRIVEKGVALMRLEFGSNAADLEAAVGPGIGPCCYEVGGELVEEFRREFEYADEVLPERDGKVYADLWEANRRQLVAAGVRPEMVTMLGECSGHQLDKYFSHRLEKGYTGRMMSVVGILPGRESSE